MFGVKLLSTALSVGLPLLGVGALVLGQQLGPVAPGGCIAREH